MRCSARPVPHQVPPPQPPQEWIPQCPRARDCDWPPRGQAPPVSAQEQASPAPHQVPPPPQEYAQRLTDILNCRPVSTTSNAGENRGHRNEGKIHQVPPPPPPQEYAQGQTDILNCRPAFTTSNAGENRGHRNEREVHQVPPPPQEYAQGQTAILNCRQALSRSNDGENRGHGNEGKVHQVRGGTEGEVASRQGSLQSPKRCGVTPTPLQNNLQKQ